MAVRKVTQAEITAAFGHVEQSQRTTPPAPTKKLPVIYEFEFEQIFKEHALTPQGKWEMEVRQRNGWELLSVGLNVGGLMGTSYLLTWRRPR